MIRKKSNPRANIKQKRKISEIITDETVSNLSEFIEGTKELQKFRQRDKGSDFSVESITAGQIKDKPEEKEGTVTNLFTEQTMPEDNLGQIGLKDHQMEKWISEQLEQKRKSEQKNVKEEKDTSKSDNDKEENKVSSIDEAIAALQSKPELYNQTPIERKLTKRQKIEDTD